MDDLIVALVVIAFFIFLYQFLKRNWSTENDPVQQATCRIVSKREEKSSIGIGNKITQLFVTVEKLHWGHEFEIQVWEKKHYDSLHEGDEGIVYFQGSWFVRFEKTETDKE